MDLTELTVDVTVSLLISVEAVVIIDVMVLLSLLLVSETVVPVDITISSDANI